MMKRKRMVYLHNPNELSEGKIYEEVRIFLDGKQFVLPHGMRKGNKIYEVDEEGNIKSLSFNLDEQKIRLIEYYERY